jgi:hypothetical protein
MRPGDWLLLLVLCDADLVLGWDRRRLATIARLRSASVCRRVFLWTLESPTRFNPPLPMIGDHK